MDSLKRLRILVMTPTLPYPPIWGFGIRVCQTTQHIAARHSVSLLTFSEPKPTSNPQELERSGIRVHMVDAPPPNSVTKRLMQFVSFFSRLSFEHKRLYSEAMQSRLTELLSEETFDIIQVESSQMAGYDFGNRSILILDEHNIEYELLQRIYQAERSPLRRLYNWVEYCKFKREEQKLWNKVDACVLTSDRECEIFSRFQPYKPAAVIPNGVDTTYFQPSTTPEDTNSIVFSGLMRYRPNIDGVYYFVKQVLPLIVRVRPDVRFTIVGARPVPAVTRLAGPNVVVTGTVSDVRPYFAAASVFVVPLRMGSGTRLKVLEGLAMGKPTVSTSVGCEGIDVIDESHLLIRDNPKAFAEAVLKLLDDREYAAALGARGREAILQKYDWQAIVHKLEAFYYDLFNLDLATSVAGPRQAGTTALGGVKSAGDPESCR